MTDKATLEWLKRTTWNKKPEPKLEQPIAQPEQKPETPGEPAKEAPKPPVKAPVTFLLPDDEPEEKEESDGRMGIIPGIRAILFRGGDEKDYIFAALCAFILGLCTLCGIIAWWSG